ncbi:MAG: AAA family ATPase, partial [Bradymonadaceae bacterium]
SRASDRASDVEGEDQSEDEAFETGAGEPEAAGRASDAASPDEATAYLDRAFSRIRDIVPQLITSLDRLHRFGHAHGDLRSSNIRISPDGRCALTDYGIVAHARFRDDSLRARPRYAVFDSYRAPEVREGAAPSPAADRYSLGCVLFELVTGCRPVRPDDADPNPLAGGALSELEPHCPAEWVDLVTRLLSRDPDERPSLESVDRAFREIRAQPVSIPPTFVPEGEAFHGRRDVLDELIETAEDCADRGELTATLVTGGPGYGKSAAVRALSQWASEHGWVVLTGECREPVARAWEPWRGVVRQLVDLLADSEEALRDRVDAPRRRAATLFPDVADGSVDRVSRIEAVRAVRELLGALASERPILLWFDDLQWADRDSLSLLADLMARPADLTCLAIGTWRGTAVDLDDHALGAELATAPVDVGRIEVPKLTADEAETFLDELAGGLRRELRRWVLANSGRNPLLIQELVYELHLRAPDAGEKRTALSELATSDEPGDALRRLIGSRLERLSRRESFVVQLMSVAGLPLSEEALVGALESEFRGGGPDEHIAGDLFHRLRRLRLIRETDSPDGGSSYRLFHDVCRRLVLEDTTDQRRRHLCGLLADVVSDLDADAPLLAFEYRRQADDDLEEHAAEAVRAARHAEDRRAYGRAADIWRWLVERPEAAERLTSAHPRRSLAEAERFAGRPAHAARHYRSTADAPPDGIERAVLRRDAFETLLESGERPDALDALEDALAHFSERYDAANVVTRFSEYKNRLVAATNRWADDLDAASTAAPGREAALRIDLYRFLVFNNDILASSRGARFRAKLSAIAETSGRALFLGWERLFRARSSHEGWRLERDRRAREWYDEAEQLFDRAECRTGATLLAVGRSDLHRKAGRFEEAEAVLDETPTSELGEADARRVS